MRNALWTIVVVLFVLWLIGFSVHFAGSLIHLLLLIIGIIVVFNYLLGRGARV